MIVVLDTNIVASATYWRGKPAHCLEAWVLGKYDLAISHPILTEYVASPTARQGEQGQHWDGRRSQGRFVMNRIC